MARTPKKKNPRTEPEARDDDGPDIEDRNEELGDRPELQECLLELYKDVEKGLENQWDRTNCSTDYWDIYNCKLGSKQYYSGNSQIFLPIVHDAVNARVTRFVNQVFPQGGRYVDVITEDGEHPHALMSLCEHYIRKARMRTTVVPALLRNGDVEGQYNVYVSWQEKKRHVVYRVETPLSPGPEPEEDVKEETITEGRPAVEVISDSDVLVLPNRAATIDDAVRVYGGSVTIVRRWSKAKIKKMEADGEIMPEAAKVLLDDMKKSHGAQRDKAKQQSDAAGVKTEGGMSFAQVYETWTELTIPPADKRDGDNRGDERRICRVYYGGERLILGCKRNPNWSDKIPLFSAPVEQVEGSFKGRSKIQPVEQTQYYANDAINEAADSSMFALMPIIMTDPERNPRTGSMVLSLAAVWECDPNSTQFAKFPDIWKSGFEIVASCKAQIMQTLSVSPAAITQSQSQKNKPSQADIAREQQVDILTTADAVTILEEGILSPVVNFMLELDHQHRRDKMLVRQFGDMGVRAKMERIGPVQMDKRWSLRWFGVEQARNQMQMQQQIAGIATIMKIPAQMYQGYRLNLVPVITHMVEGLFGPRLAPLIFVDQAKEVTLDAKLENEWLIEGTELAIHPMDPDPEHVQVHQQALQQTGDPNGVIRRHIARHMMQMQMKQQAALMQAAQQMMAGGGEGGAHGRAGAQPRGARGNGQQHPGAAHRDQIGPQSGAMPQLRQGGQ